MKASVGDRLVMASSVVDGPVRDGRVVRLRHEDGSPPYLVQWSDTGEETLVFPGPDAHVEHHEADETVAASEPAVRVGTWRVEVTLVHDGRDTTARAVLLGDAAGLGAQGLAHRNPADPEVAGIGDEVAVARALRHLADGLVAKAEADITEATGRAAHLV